MLVCNCLPVSNDAPVLPNPSSCFSPFSLLFFEPSFPSILPNMPSHYLLESMGPPVDGPLVFVAKDEEGEERKTKSTASTTSCGVLNSARMLTMLSRIQQPVAYM